MQIQENKYSIIKSEVISHPISGAVRATLVNRHDSHEDVAFIGDTLVKTLWPFLYKKHKGDMILINKELIRDEYLVLLNRPPTISNLSIMAMKPRIASLYPHNKFSNSHMGLKRNYAYEFIYLAAEQNYNKKNTKLRKKFIDGDIEKYENVIPNEDFNYKLSLKETSRWYKAYKNNEISKSTYQNKMNLLEYQSNKFKRYFLDDLKNYEKIEIRYDLEETIFEEMIDKYEELKLVSDNKNKKLNYVLGDRKGIRTIGTNPIMTDGLAADYDGDVILLIAIYTKQATDEATLMLPSIAFMNYANGTIRNTIIKDFLYPITQ